MRAALLFACACAGCSPWEVDTTEPTIPSTTVIGVTADEPLLGAIERVEVRVMTGLEELLASELAADFPIEVVVPPLPDQTPLSIHIAAFGAGDDVPLIVRSATTATRSGRTPLVPLRFNDECSFDTSDVDIDCGGSPALSCIGGVCELNNITADALPDYSPTWAASRDGDCGPIAAVEPVVEIGAAQAPFRPLVDGDLVTPEEGHQGGQHFFYSVRMSGADRETTRTTATGTILETGEDRAPVYTMRPYSPSGGSCQLFEEPFVMPVGEHAGKTLRLEVFVTDATGNTGHAHVNVVLDETIPL